ncbi:MAG TPA: phosphoenolpyruvate--protein phosphotransferase [Anaerolineae bacterium]
MIGLVIVSHSARLAEGVRELINQMTKGQVPLAIAGGLSDPQNPIGTDAFAVQEAIEAVYSDDGVVVFMDLGSALLSAETALEFLTEEQRARIRLCEAPLVEGAVAAAVQAMAANDIDQVIAEARGALAAKAAQLQQLVPEAASQPEPAVAATLANEILVTIPNRLGLHARPAADFVTTAAGFQAEITVRNATRGVGPVNAKSLNRVATLGARQGQALGIAAQGSDAAGALAALKALVEAGFGETDEALETATSPQTITRVGLSEGELAGIPASPGIAIGPSVRYQLVLIETPEGHVDDPQAEWQRLQAAIRTAQREIKIIHEQALAQVGEKDADIFKAHLLSLEDPALVDEAHWQIFERHHAAGTAWQTVINGMVESYRALEDPYQQARAADLTDVGQRVLRLLTGTTPAPLELSEPSILVATELTPSDTARLDPDKVLGICTERGGATSHSSILAKALGIPAVSGLGPGITRLAEGTILALDGQQGQVWVDPTLDKQVALKKEREIWLAGRESARVASQQPALTCDGHRVEIVANIRGATDAKVALQHGAEGVGLLRTELLFLDRLTEPSEAEQQAAYTAIADVLGARPLIIRTLDIGGDKPLPYLDAEPEANPFLGWRGIRIGLARPHLLKTQLRAILQASPGHHLKLMFPMISSLAELRAARAVLAEAQTELRQTGTPFDETIEVGIMIEVPASVAIADQLAAEVDFFSIGTNDLTQYATAADRTNARVAALADPFHPAVLRLINQTIAAAHAAGIWVGLCGEFAGDPLATPILLGLGLDEFSMSGPAIPLVKQTIGQLTMAEAEAIAQAVLKLDSAEAVRAYVAG